MASAKTKDFEVFETIIATAVGNVKTIDLNTFVNVAEMEAFGIEAVEIGINATETTPSTSVYQRAGCANCYHLNVLIKAVNFQVKPRGTVVTLDK